MRIVNWSFAGIALIACLTGCGGTQKVVIDNYRESYSVEVEGVSDAAISDGLPEGLNVNSVSKNVYNEVITGLANKGLTKNNNKKSLKVKYNILYFGHKWKGGFKPEYIIAYNIQLIDTNTGRVIASDKEDKDDSELLKVIDDVSDNLVNFVTDNIK